MEAGEEYEKNGDFMTKLKYNAGHALFLFANEETPPEKA